LFLFRAASLPPVRLDPRRAGADPIAMMLAQAATNLLPPDLIVAARMQQPAEK
jgi:hypothetical protein